MNNGIKKPDESELIDDLIAIYEIKERINTLEIVRLKELILQIDKMIINRLDLINQMLIANHNHESTKMRTFQFWAGSISQYGFNYYILEELKELINNRIDVLNKDQIIKDSEVIYPFRDLNNFELFKSFLQLNIIHPYRDISYLFQRLKNENMIESITQIRFMEWLLKNEFISQNIYNDFIIKNQFYSLKKVNTKERENKFDVHFNLL